MQAITLNDQLISYQHRIQGGGPCVVFANSLGSDQSLWDGVINRLPRGFDTLTYDMRGHGLSGIASGYDVTDLADDLIGLLQFLDLRDVVLSGVSVGGMVAQSVAARRPDLLCAVVLSNTAAKIGNDDRWNARISAVQTDGVAGITDTILSNWFAPDYKQANPDRWAMHRNMLSRTPDDGYIATCVALRDTDLRAETGKIAVRAICVTGAQDTSVLPQQVADLAANIPGARLEVLESVGHLPAVEAPGRIAKLIEDIAHPMANRLDIGMATRRAVLGDTHVDLAEAAKTPFDLPFQTLIAEGAWGNVWSSHGISRRERSMLTLALLAATGNFDEIAMHVRATKRTGATSRDIQEAFQHVAIYAGVPRANRALKITKQILAEMDDAGDD